MDKKPLFNPLPSDFSYIWLDDDNVKHTLTIPSKEIVYFTVPQFHFMAKHLADEIVNVRGIKTNHEDEYKEIIKEISVTI